MEFLHFLAQLRTPIGDAFFLFATYGGEELTLLGLICVLFWCVDKRLAYRMCFAYLPSALAVNILKLTCRVERPWVRDPSFVAVEKAKGSATGYSFPSGHTQNATALFGTLSYKVRRVWLKIVLFLLIPLVMLSRMYLGVHTPADVLTSFCVSSVIVFGINLVADRMEMTEKRRLIIMLFFLAIAIVTVIYTYLLYQGGIIEYKDAADCFKGCGGGIGFSICWFLETKYIRFDPKCDNIGLQLLKFGIGLTGVLVLKSGIKLAFNAMFGPSFFTDVFRYFLVMVWAILVMPLIIKKFFSSKEPSKE